VGVFFSCYPMVPIPPFFAPFPRSKSQVIEYIVSDRERYLLTTNVRGCDWGLFEVLQVFKSAERELRHGSRKGWKARRWTC
jgi:hypothetical protein